jgi:hypothetical protein
VETNIAKSVGLCATCIHLDLIRSDRGSLFYLCGLSFKDPHFPKYPPLPVLSCAGYEARPAASAIEV